MEKSATLPHDHERLLAKPTPFTCLYAVVPRFSKVVRVVMLCVRDTTIDGRTGKGSDLFDIYTGGNFMYRILALASGRPLPHDLYPIFLFSLATRPTPGLQTLLLVIYWTPSLTDAFANLNGIRRNGPGCLSLQRSVGEEKEKERERERKRDSL